jgi:hypothetical protein
MLIYVKHLVSILVFLFLSLVIGNYLIKRLSKTSIRSTIEGMETDNMSSFMDAASDTDTTTGPATTTDATGATGPATGATSPATGPATTTGATSPATTATGTVVNTVPSSIEPCDIKDVDKPIELAAAFEKVNKQTDMIRTLNEVAEPVTPLKIDKSGDAEFLVLSNLKLLVNNGISKNEASLKAVYDQYIGNREVSLLATDMNSLKIEKANADALHKQEIAIICRAKVIIEGHQTLIDRILEKGSDE